LIIFCNFSIKWGVVFFCAAQPYIKNTTYPIIEKILIFVKNAGKAAVLWCSNDMVCVPYSGLIIPENEREK
jgi:hypothetical protein